MASNGRSGTTAFRRIPRPPPTPLGTLLGHLSPRLSAHLSNTSRTLRTPVPAGRSSPRALVCRRSRRLKPEFPVTNSSARSIATSKRAQPSAPQRGEPRGLLDAIGRGGVGCCSGWRFGCGWSLVRPMNSANTIHGLLLGWVVYRCDTTRPTRSNEPQRPQAHDKTRPAPQSFPAREAGPEFAMHPSRNAPGVGSCLRLSRPPVLSTPRRFQERSGRSDSGSERRSSCPPTPGGAA